MNERIKPDYSAKLHSGEDEYLVSPKYDHLQQFRWLGHAILRYISAEGVQHIHISSEAGDMIAEATGIPSVDMEFMFESDYEKYLEAQAANMDSWND